MTQTKPASLTREWTQKGGWHQLWRTQKIQVTVQELPVQSGPLSYSLSVVSITINGKIVLSKETAHPFPGNVIFLPLHVKTLSENPYIDIKERHRDLLKTFCGFFEKELEGVTISWHDNSSFLD